MSPNPIADLGRDGRALHLTFLHLTEDQLTEMQRLLMHNGQGELYRMRSEAGAHLDQWDSKRGLVSLHLYGQSPTPFMAELGRRLGVFIPNECNPDYSRVV